MEERHLHAMDGVSDKMATMVKYKENTTVRGTKGYYKAELSPCPNPDLYSYNSMLTSWKNSSDDNLEKIKKMFDQMKTDLNIPDPDSTTYNIVMGEWIMRKFLLCNRNRSFNDIVHDYHRLFTFFRQDIRS